MKTAKAIATININETTSDGVDLSVTVTIDGKVENVMSNLFFKKNDRVKITLYVEYDETKGQPKIEELQIRSPL